MTRMLKLELINCLSRREFKFIFAILMSFSIGSFLIVCLKNYGQGASLIRSAYEMSIMQGTSTGVVLSIQNMLIPLFASIIYSDSYYSDHRSGVYKNILTRTDTKTYFWAKAIVIIVVTFTVFLIPLFLNQLLSLLAFPTQGFDNNFAFPPYDIGIQNYQSGFMFDLLRIQSPLLYNLLYMFLISLVASLFALFAYGAYFVSNKGKFATIVGVFLIYIVTELAVSTLGFRLSLNNLLQPGNRGSFGVLMLWIAVLFVLSIGMIAAKGFTHDVGIEK